LWAAAALGLFAAYAWHERHTERPIIRLGLFRTRTFNVAVAEVDDQDTWQAATLGMACVSADARHADEMTQKVLRFIEEHQEDALLTTTSFELVHV